jgi:DNA-binding transcriptional LysR family regulator
LKAVATEENLTAAELLYVSQPSLSKQIKTLEKWISFDKSRK